jgi:hypothetical protein
MIVVHMQSLHFVVPNNFLESSTWHYNANIPISFNLASDLFQKKIQGKFKVNPTQNWINSHIVMRPIPLNSKFK